MKSSRVITIVVLLGVVIAAVTFLGAAHMLGDDATSAKDVQKIIGPVKTGSNGVVVYGNVDLDNGAGLLPLYPETLPLPSTMKKVFVVEGQQVAKGDKLAEFDTKLADLNVEEAKKGLAQAEAAVRRAEAGIQRAEAAVKIADQTLQAHEVLVKSTEKTVEGKAGLLAAAKVDLDEVSKKLTKINVEPTNDPEYRSSKKKFDSADSDLAAEKIKLEGMQAIAPTSKKDEALAGVAEAKAGVLEAKAAVAKQQVVLDKALYGLSLTVLTAPDNGKIVRSFAAEGLTFGPQTRQPAFLFQPKGRLIVRAEVDQEFASRVAVGQTAVIHDDGNPNLKWTGKVSRVADAFLPKRASPTSPDGLMLNDSRVLECIVSIEGGDPNAPPRIGQRVTVSIGAE